MKAISANTTGEPGQSFTERHGGWILSACFHVILFAALVLQRQAAPILPINRKAETIRVNLAGPEGAIAMAAAELTAAPGNEPDPEPLDWPEPVISMRNAVLAGPAPTPAPEAAVPEAPPAEASLSAALRPMTALEVDPAAMLKPLGGGAVDESLVASPDAPAGEGSDVAGNPDAGGSTEPGPGSPDGMYAMGARSKRGDGIGGEGTGAGMPGSAVVGGKIMAAQADLAAQKTLFAPQGGLFAGRGASAGAIRSIELNGVDGDQAKQVLERYGIAIMMIPAGESGRGALRRGPGQEQLVTRYGSGALGIFRITSVAANKMGKLEDEALRREGYDPAKTRITKVTFGIMGTPDGGYDLGVIDMKTEPLVLPREKVMERAR